jgi:hypothetical protein
MNKNEIVRLIIEELILYMSEKIALFCKLFLMFNSKSKIFILTIGPSEPIRVSFGICDCTLLIRVVKEQLKGFLIDKNIAFPLMNEPFVDKIGLYGLQPS